MSTTASLALDRQRRLIAVTTTARNRTLVAWRQMDFDNLDASWDQVSPAIIQQVTAAQLTLAAGADRFNAQVATSYDFDPQRSKLAPPAFAGVDGDGRAVSGILRGAVTTTKEAVGAGFGRVQAMETGAAYLAAMVKTVIADMGRSADIVSATGKGFTHYIRVVNPGACSRCAILAGISSGEVAFKRHISCHCTAVASPNNVNKVAGGLFSTPEEYFDSLSDAEQDRIFTKAGAQSIRDGASVSKVVSARRGADGIGYSHRISTRSLTQNRLVKTTIGVRPDGSPVQVYTTTEGTTVRGAFGKAQQRTSAVRKAAGARYTSTSRVRLMPESIMEIAGKDLKVRQAFLRDAGYLEYVPHSGYDAAGRWIQEIESMRRADRILVDRATKAYGNFYLG